MKKVSDVFKVGQNNIGWVDNSFTKEFGEDEFSDTEPRLIPYTLSKSMNDSEIIKEFNIQECSLGEVMAMMLNPSPEMKDGYYNIFYIKGHPSRVVDVSWISGRGEWGVRDWRRGGLDWAAGRRVFSPATEAGSISTMTSDSLTLDQAIKIVKEAGLKVIKTVVTEQEL